MTTLWSFILVLSGLIFVHELGHFLVARGLGIRVLKFSIGFGPRVWGIVKDKTDYCISAVPLGGFVKMLGEVPDEPVDEADIPVSFSHRPVWHRAAVVIAGPLFNLLFAWLVFVLILLFYGDPVMLPEIGQVQPDSPAAAAGITAGDRILSVNGVEVNSWDDVSDRIKGSDGRPVTLLLDRKGRAVSVTVVPKLKTLKNVFGEDVQVPVIGVVASGNLVVEKVNPFSALWKGFVRTWDMIVLTVEGFIKIFENVVPVSSLGGPIMIAQMAGQQAEQGMLNLFFFMAILSINLGILNLLPVPVLDGGHLVFFLIEAIIGHPLSVKQMQFAQQVGFAILGSLMLLVFYNDIARVFGLLPPLGTP